MQAPTIPEFFAGRSVFVTGGTGFLGKALIEKLLRSCPEVHKVFVLVRAKRGSNAEERVKALMQNGVFERLRGELGEQWEQQRSKVVGVEGDVAELGLGLTPGDRQMLLDQVSVTFHGAASIRFDDPMKKACLMNTRGTLQVIELCRAMRSFAVLVHVSTTFCNSDRWLVEERLYPAPACWRQMVRLCEAAEGRALEVMTDKLLEGHRNTYSFTKALAEQVVADHHSQVPAVIIRPSIVIAALSEPVAGWSETIAGPIGMVMAAGKGVLSGVMVGPSVRSDYVVVDLLTRATIACAWDRVVNRGGCRDVPVYNYAGDMTTKTSRHVQEVALQALEEVPYDEALWAPQLHLYTSTRWYTLHTVIFQVLPALVLDYCAPNSKIQLARLQRKIYLGYLAIGYFLTNEWTFVNKEKLKLDGRVLDEDRPNFGFKVSGDGINMYQYIRDSILWTRLHYFKDSPDLEPAKKRNRRLHWMDKGVKGLMLAGAVLLAAQLGVHTTLTTVLASLLPV